MFWYLYRLPLWTVILIIAVAVPVWSVIMSAVSQKSGKTVRILGIVLALISLAGIVYITLCNRTQEERKLVIRPFQSFIEAKTEKEMYREMLMNVFLFVPLGMSLPFLFEKAGEKGMLKAFLIPVISAVVLSIAIEAIQYLFGTGRCETDDVLCNTLGAALGAVSVILFYLIRRKND